MFLHSVHKCDLRGLDEFVINFLFSPVFYDMKRYLIHFPLENSPSLHSFSPFFHNEVLISISVH